MSYEQSMTDLWRPLELYLRTHYSYTQEAIDEHRQTYQKTLTSVLRATDLHSSSPLQFDENSFFRKNTSLSLNFHPKCQPLAWHYHDFYEMIYVMEGGCVNYLEGTTMDMQVGDLCILPPNELHTLECFRDEEIVLHILIRKSTFHQSFGPLLSGYGILSSFFSHTMFQQSNSAYLLFRCGEDAAIRTLIDQMLAEYTQTDAYSQGMLSGLLMQLLAQLLRNHQLDTIHVAGKCQSKPAHISKMLQYIEEHIVDVTLQEIAQAFNYSESRCSSIFKDATGKNFNQLLRESKAKKAAYLLRETDHSLTAIAAEVGFFDSSHMNKVFTSIYGTSPSRYRKKHP